MFVVAAAVSGSVGNLFTIYMWYYRDYDEPWSVQMGYLHALGFGNIFHPITVFVAIFTVKICSGF